MRNLITWNPVGNVPPLHRDVDRFFDEFLTPSRSGSGNWTPTADVVEKGDHYILTLDLPGLQREDINVNVEDGQLVVRGSRKIDRKDEKDNWIRSERYAGEFVRSFRLGDKVSTEGIAAAYTDGVLEVKVPKVEAALPRQIEIK